MMTSLTPRTAKQQGLSRSGLYRAAQDGRIERIARGIYLPEGATAADWDWIEAATRQHRATICLTSALAHYDLTDTIPSALDIAIPRGTRIPAGNSSIAWHSFDKPTFNLGRTEIPIPGTDQSIGIYSAERTITDAFRLRGTVGYEIARGALKEWLQRGGKPAHLIEFAAILPRAKGPILTALDALT